MTHALELRDAIERAERQADYARKELRKFMTGADFKDPRVPRQQAKLEDYVRRSENDLTVLKQMLAAGVGR